MSTPTNPGSQTLTGTTDAGATVTVATSTSASDGTATVSGSNWSYTITGLVWGANDVTVTALDGAGRKTARSKSITRNPKLDVILSGTGGGTVTSNPEGIRCPTGNCSNLFNMDIEIR